MMRNPDVTVRSRGVMEKCTYCVQRINEHRIDAETRRPQDRTTARLQTACQQSCPAEAIVFGNINDPNSRVSKLKAQVARITVCWANLNTRPRTTYLARAEQSEPEIEESVGSRKTMDERIQTGQSRYAAELRSSSRATPSARSPTRSARSC